jgi:hypothetical protein
MMYYQQILKHRAFLKIWSLSCYWVGTGNAKFEVCSVVLLKIEVLKHQDLNRQVLGTFILADSST